MGENKKESLAERLKNYDPDKGSPSRIFSGADILKNKGLAYNIPLNPDMTFKGDIRFDRAVEYASAIGAAIKSKNAEMLPDGVDKSIITAKGEVQEKMLSEAFQTKVHELYGKYDGKTGLALKKEDDELKQFTKKILGKKPDEELTEQDAKKMMNLLKENKLSPKQMKEFEDIYLRNAHSLQTAKFPKENGAESTRLVGKDSENPDRGLICRHQAPLKAAMWAAAGFEGAKVVNVDRHVTVITPLGNVDEGTVDNPKNAYLVTAFGGLDSLTQKGGGGTLIAFNGSGKFSYLTNPGISRKPSEQELSDVQKLSSFLKNHDAAKFYQEAIETPGPVDPQTIRNAESAKPQSVLPKRHC